MELYQLVLQLSSPYHRAVFTDPTTPGSAGARTSGSRRTVWGISDPPLFVQASVYNAPFSSLSLPPSVWGHWCQGLWSIACFHLQHVWSFWWNSTLHSSSGVCVCRNIWMHSTSWIIYCAIMVTLKKSLVFFKSMLRWMSLWHSCTNRKCDVFLNQQKQKHWQGMHNINCNMHHIMTQISWLIYC